MQALAGMFGLDNVQMHRSDEKFAERSSATLLSYSTVSVTGGLRVLLIGEDATPSARSAHRWRQSLWNCSGGWEAFDDERGLSKYL